jgi:hypothetical protein
MPLYANQDAAYEDMSFADAARHALENNKAFYAKAPPGTVERLQAMAGGVTAPEPVTPQSVFDAGVKSVDEAYGPLDPFFVARIEEHQKLGAKDLAERTEDVKAQIGETYDTRIKEAEASGALTADNRKAVLADKASLLTLSARGRYELRRQASRPKS